MKRIKYIMKLATYVTICASILILPRFRQVLWECAAGCSTLDDRLLAAVATGDRKTFDQMLARGASVNAHDRLGVTALMTAATLNRVDLAQPLIERGADVNLADDYGSTALIYAAEAGRMEMIRLLLAHGADPSHRGLRGRTAREVALYFLHPDAAAVLSTGE